MIAKKNKVVAVSYELRVAGKSELIEKVTDQQPLKFILGSGNLLQKFEENLTGLKIGDSFDFVLKTEEAYGVVNQEAIVELPKNIFEVNGVVDEEMLSIGNTIPMSDHNGNRFNGKVIDVTAELVKMDFNHPLAGESLHFKGAVVEVREATEEELEHGHLHSENAGGCGCGSGCGCGDSEASCDSGSGGCGSGCGCN